MPSPRPPTDAASTHSDDRLIAYLRQAVDLALEEVERGGIPFSALVIDPRKGVIGSGVNRVLAERDPTAHAEIVALRDAGQGRRDPGELSGCTLIASGEPCGMCYLGALDAHISTVLYAVDRVEAARYGFDYRHSYRLLAEQSPQRWSSVTVRLWSIPGGLEPFTAWSRRHPTR